MFAFFFFASVSQKICLNNKVIFLVTIVKILHCIQHTFSFRVQSVPSKHSSWWRCLEDVLKTSFVFVFRRRLQKTSWSRPIYSSWSCVFKNSSRRFEDVFKTSSRHLAKTSSKCLQDVFKTFSRFVIKLNCSC